MQLRTDGVHCRESAGSRPVNLKVVPNECCRGRSPWTNLICASFSHTHYWYDVGTLQVMAGVGGHGRPRIKRAMLYRVSEILYAGEVSIQPKISHCVSSQTRIEIFNVPTR